MSRSNGICCAVGALVALCGVVRADERSPGDTSGAERDASSRTTDSAEDTIEEITARALFLEGRALLDKAQPREACATLERSHALNPTLATLLNLGLCHKALGRVVTAHDYYRQAEVQATLRGDALRREFAHDEAAALAPLRATLTLRVSGPRGAALEVLVDGKPRSREIWSQPIFIDSGEHRIAVRSTDDQTWEGSVVIVDGGKHVVVVPAFGGRPQKLEATPESPFEAPAPPATSPSLTKPAAREQPERGSPLGTQHIVAVSAGAAGLGALAVSLIYAVNARATWNESNTRGCDRVSSFCSPRGLALRDDARADATRSTVFGIVGGAALVGGLVLWLAAPRAPEERARLSVTTSTDAIAATWSTRL